MEANTSTKEYSSDEISLKSLISRIGETRRYVLRRWYVLLVLAILGFVSGYFYEKSKPVLYTASTTFILESGGSRAVGGGLSGLGSILGAELGAGASNSLFQGQSLIELYKSAAILRKVLLTPLEGDSSKLLITKLFEINEDLFEKRNPNLDKFLTNPTALLSPGEEQLRTRDSILNVAVKVLRKDYFLVDFPNAKASFIKVDTYAEDEDFAKTLNDELVKKVSDLYMEIKAGKSYESINILQHKVDSVHVLMLRSLSESAISSDQTPNLNRSRESLRLIPTEQARSNFETNKALYTEFNRNLEMAKLSISKEVPLIKVIDEATYPLEKRGPNTNKIGLIGAFVMLILGSISLSLIYLYKMILEEENQ